MTTPRVEFYPHEKQLLLRAMLQNGINVGESENNPKGLNYLLETGFVKARSTTEWGTSYTLTTLGKAQARRIWKEL